MGGAVAAAEFQTQIRIHLATGWKMAKKQTTRLRTKMRKIITSIITTTTIITTATRMRRFINAIRRKELRRRLSGK